MKAPIPLIERTVSSRPRPRFAICTLGCKLNQSDEEEIRRDLRSAGLTEVAFADQADVYIVNTCTVTHLADRRSRQMLRRAKRQNPESLVAAIGCYPSVAPEELRAIDEVDLVAGSIDKLTVVDDILTRVEWDHAAFDLERPLDQVETRTRRTIKIQEGCRAHCTYCVIPRARGGPRNIGPDQVAKEMQQSVESGYREIVLTGTHVGTYKWPNGDQTLRLADLLEYVLDHTAVERLRVTSVGPHEIDERFISILKRPRMSPHLHMALQSGSTTVLRRMKRWYNLQQFRRSVRRLREEIPEIGITTDVIVGFPGETDQEFQETCDFAREMAFAKIHVFPFSARRETAAASMPDQIPSRVKDRRSARLRDIADDLHTSFVHSQLSYETEVLLEQPHDDILPGTTVWNGFTGNYLRVYVPSSDNLHNRIVTVVPEAAIRDGALSGAPVRIS
ncbi:MAG: tRNA (N(6)-L-threonylcarbamoyladenosine(37)-C(2))-methylthiotransferase MtaB [Nitrolancea sp.]